MSVIQVEVFVTRSRKRGSFTQNSNYKLDLSAGSVKSVVHTCENCLMLAHRFPKL